MLGAVLWLADANAQCESWNNSPMKEDLINHHVIYKGALKVEDWKTAEENWEKVFKSAFGGWERESQFWDGAEIHEMEICPGQRMMQKKMIKDKILGHLQTIYQLCHVREYYGKIRGRKKQQDFMLMVGWLLICTTPSICLFIKTLRPSIMPSNMEVSIMNTSSLILLPALQFTSSKQWHAQK